MEIKTPHDALQALARHQAKIIEYLLIIRRSKVSTEFPECTIFPAKDLLQPITTNEVSQLTPLLARQYIGSSFKNYCKLIARIDHLGLDIDFEWHEQWLEEAKACFNAFPKESNKHKTDSLGRRRHFRRQI